MKKWMFLLLIPFLSFGQFNPIFFGGDTSGRNLFQKTEEFDNAYWSRTDVTITANSTNDPNSNLTADKVLENLGGSLQRIFKTFTFKGGYYTYSCYFKQGAGTRNIGLKVFTPTGDFGWVFDITSGVDVGVMTTKTAPFRHSITSAGGGWYRCSITVTSTAGSGDVGTFMSIGNGIGHAGDGTSYIYAWGAQ